MTELSLFLNIVGLVVDVFMVGFSISGLYGCLQYRFNYFYFIFGVTTLSAAIFFSIFHVLNIYRGICELVGTI